MLTSQTRTKTKDTHTHTHSNTHTHTHTLSDTLSDTLTRTHVHVAHKNWHKRNFEISPIIAKLFQRHLLQFDVWRTTFYVSILQRTKCLALFNPKFTQWLLKRVRMVATAWRHWWILRQSKVSCVFKKRLCLFDTKIKQRMKKTKNWWSATLLWFRLMNFGLKVKSSLKWESFQFFKTKVITYTSYKFFMQPILVEWNSWWRCIWGLSCKTLIFISHVDVM